MAHFIYKAAALSLVLFSFSWGDVIDGLDYQSESVATSNLVSAGTINPAGLAFYSSMGLRYSHGFTDSSYKGDDALLISSKRGFFGIEWLNHTTDNFRRKFTLAFGDRLASNFYFGVSFSWFNGSPFYKKIRLLKFGLLYHPHPIMSLGFIADRINEPRFNSLRQKRLYRPGIAVRPFEEKITISADLRWIEGTSLSGLDGNARIEISPISRFHFGVEYATEGDWRMGFTYDIEQAKVGGQGRLAQSGEFNGGSYFVELGAVNYGSALKAGRTGFLSIGKDIVEEPGRRSLWNKPGKPFFKVITALRKAASDSALKDILISIDNPRLSFASAQEVRGAILDARKKNKKVTAYLNNGNNISYYLATAADKIAMSPSGYLDLRGIYATATFYTGTMEKLGIGAQVISTGPHKTYGDAFTEKGLTDESRDQLNWLLDDLYDQIVSDIATSRRLTGNEVRELIDEGPYTAKDAFTAGLIDKLAYYDDLIAEKESGLSGGNDLYEHYNKKYYSARWSEPKTIAIVFVDGSIKSGASGKSLWDGKVAGSSTLSAALKSVRDDNKIKAVVLRVNSPGGELFASDEVYRGVELLKGKKPLVVSMGGVAASGGYYISLSGDDILASPASITGSIGVVAGKPDMSGFYEKIGLKKETIKRGRHADLRSFDRPATDEEVGLVEEQIEQYYNDFIGKVSSWRKIGIDSVDAIAGGRVWTGRQALQRGLIDSYGGIWEAVELARKRAGIDSEDQLIIRTYPEYGFLLFNPPVTALIESEFTGFMQMPTRNHLSLRLPYDLKIE